MLEQGHIHTFHDEEYPTGGSLPRGDSCLHSAKYLIDGAFSDDGSHLRAENMQETGFRRSFYLSILLSFRQ
jgi:hypothetical protein